MKEPNPAIGDLGVGPEGEGGAGCGHGVVDFGSRRLVNNVHAHRVASNHASRYGPLALLVPVQETEGVSTINSSKLNTGSRG